MLINWRKCRSNWGDNQREHHGRMRRMYTGGCLSLLAGLASLGCNSTSGAEDVGQLATALVAPQTKARGDVTYTVTLVTGDRVFVQGEDAQSVRVEPAKGRENIAFSTERVVPRPGERPHLYVFPEDALPLLGADKVDRRLFDVTLLIDYGYDDAHRDSVPLIVSFVASRSKVMAAKGRGIAGAVTGQDLHSINGVSAVASKALLSEVWAALSSRASASKSRAISGASEPVAKLWLDGLRQPFLDRSVHQIAATSAWDLGYHGEGVRVAVLDSGVDVTHPDLSDRVAMSANFTEGSDGDLVGHGTHVASIIAGSGAASEGRYRGVAAGVQILSGKVCELRGCPESSIVAGMQWAAAEMGAPIVNVSIGGPDSPELDPLEEAVNTLTNQYGVLFVVAAGNSGPDSDTIESPGSAEAALTVGAATRDDGVARFSSRGLTAGLLLTKPDVLAPGDEIVAVRATGTQLGTMVGESYVTASGSSMAAPHVAGVAAMLLQQHPTWRQSELKAAIMGSAVYNANLTVLDQGAGRVDVAAAWKTSLIADTTSANFGIVAWPHDDDVPVTRTITYRNLGPATELRLGVEVTGPDGKLAPNGMFTVMPTALTLPEGATAAVTVTADPRIDSPNGIYSGRLVASNGAGQAVGVPVFLNREDESYDLVLRHVDRSGAPTTDFLAHVAGLDRVYSRSIAFPMDVTDIKLHLPAGRYAIKSAIYDSEMLTWLIAPNQRLDGDRLLVMDARQAPPLLVVAPRTELKSTTISAAVRIPATAQTLSWSMLTNSDDSDPHFFMGELPPANPDLESLLLRQWIDPAEPGANLYSAAWSGQGTLPVIREKALEARKFAAVQSHYAAALPVDPSSWQIAFPVVSPWTENSLSVLLLSESASLPYVRSEYFYADDGAIRWLNELIMLNNSEFFTQGMKPVAYRPHHQYSTSVNRPPFSLVLPERNQSNDWAYRQGDRFVLSIPTYGDRDGHAAFSPGETRIEIYRNGEKITRPEQESGGEFEVPPEYAQYRVHLSTAQSTFRLTTREEIDWTFRSAHVPIEETDPLPLLSIRFQPELNERGEARRGAKFRLPISVAQYGRHEEPRVEKMALDVSFDDGATWRSVRVHGEGSSRHAIYDHPTSATHASLRLRTQDCQGNAVEQTVIRAYALAESP